MYDEETEEYIGNVEELSGKIADLTKTANKPGGISLFTDANKTTYKSTYQLLKDISEIYDDLTDKQQAGLLEALAGKRQGQIVAATITNFEAAEEALRNMANSAGSAEAELATYQESAEYLFNQFKETFTSIAQNAIKRDDLKNLIKAGTTILEIVDKIVSQIGLIPTILTTAVGIISSKKLTNGGLFGIGLNEKTGKTGMTFLGSQIGKGWFSSFKAQRMEIKANQQALLDFEAEMNKGVITQQTYNKVMNNSDEAVRKVGAGLTNGTAAARDYSKDLGQVGAKAKLAEIGVQALNTATSMLISMGVSLAISAIFKAVGDATKVVENHVNKINELSGKESSLKSEIETLIGDLKETKEKIAELEGMDDLTLLQEGELENLKKTNDELERQIRLKRGELAKTSSDMNKEAQDLWLEMTENEKQSWWSLIPVVREFGNISKVIKGEKTDWTDFVPLVGQFVDGVEDLSKVYQHDLFVQQTADLEKYKELLENLENYKNSDAYKAGDAYAETMAEAGQEVLDKLHDRVQKHYSDEWVALATGLDPSLNENKEILEKINKAMKEWEDLNKTVYTNMQDLFNDANFSVAIKQLEELAEKGELTVEAFEKFTNEDISSIEEFKEALESIDGATFEELLKSINRRLEDTKKKFDEATMSAEEFAKALEKLDKVLSKQEKLVEAYKKIRLNGFLSPMETNELLKEMPELIEYIDQVAGGYTISAENIKAANKEITESDSNTLRQAILTKSQQIAELEKLNKLALDVDNTLGKDNDIVEQFGAQWEKTEDLRKMLGVTSTGDLSQAIADLNEGLKQSKFELSLIEDAFDGLFIADFFDDAKSAVSDYNSEIKTLDNAIKTLGDGAALTYEEMVSLVDIAPELQKNNLITDLGDGRYSVEIKELEKLREMRYKVRNEYIDGLIEQGKAELEAAQRSKEILQLSLYDLKKFGTEAQQLAAQIELDAASAVAEQIEDALSKLEAMKGDLTVGDDSDVSKDLQNQIDYYKNIISAVEIMRDKYSEAFEKEKEALENEKQALKDGKDALKEANDERQRELDLREALINLENAKKRKVMVYSEGSGFKQVADEKAVKEAEEKYRDAITAVQEAEIDKKIAEIDKKIEENEKQQEAFEKSLEDMTKLEQNIEDAKTVEQAKTALGLADEKDLLNLSDAVKEGIKNGLAEAIIEKDNKDNKDNEYYTPADLNDVLKSMGASVTAEDLKAMKSELPTQAVYDAAVKGFADSLKEFSEKAVQNVTNNNGMVISPTFNIYDASDPKKIAEAVNSEMTDLLTRYNNSIK